MRFISASRTSSMEKVMVLLESMWNTSVSVRKFLLSIIQEKTGDCNLFLWAKRRPKAKKPGKVGDNPHRKGKTEKKRGRAKCRCPADSCAPFVRKQCCPRMPRGFPGHSQSHRKGAAAKRSSPQASRLSRE